MMDGTTPIILIFTETRCKKRCKEFPSNQEIVMDMTVATEVEEAAKAKKRIGKLIAYVDGVRKLVSKKKGIVYQGIVRLPKGKKLTKVFTVEQDAIDWRIAEIAKLAVRQVTNVGDQKTPGEMTMPQL